MLGSGRFLSKHVDSISKVFNAKPKARHCANKSEIKVVIPARIERQPTDILKALASTVNLDPTAFPYIYQDDPYFYPYTQAEKRVFALSLESGRKSAQWILKENPGFFKHQLAEPPIQAFLLKSDSESEKEVSEEALLRAIEERNVLRATEIYEGLKGGKKDVQNSTKQSLLELVCFYKGQEKPDVGMITKWFQGHLGRAKDAETQKLNWSENTFARSLYEEMDKSCPKAVSALIQGMVKNTEMEKAVNLYESAKVRKIKLSVGVYNCLLSEALSIVGDWNKICPFVMEKLSEMSEENVRPNLGTLNGALKALSETNHITVAQNLMKEFMGLGIRPSLGSFGYFFQICRRLRNLVDSQSTLRGDIEQILKQIEGEDYEILHPSDLDFFSVAMEVFANDLEDCDLALQLHALYLKPCNRKFVARARNEYIYYKQFFIILFKSKPIDFAMELFHRYVYTCANPEAKVLTVAISAIHQSLKPEHLVRFWEDLCKVGYSFNRMMLKRIFAMMSDFTDEASLQVFHKAAINFVVKLEDILPGDESELWNILLVFVKTGDEEQAAKLLGFMKENEIIGPHLAKSTVTELFEFALSKQNVPIILEVMRLASETEFPETGEMAKKCLPLLSGKDEAWVRTLLTQSGGEGEKQTK